jgi:hypothetical protein
MGVVPQYSISTTATVLSGNKLAQKSVFLQKNKPNDKQQY